MKNNNIIIIGASSGIGRKMAEYYAINGAKVGIIARREHLLEDIKSLFPENIFIKCSDIADGKFVADFKDLIHTLNGVNLVIIASSVIDFPKDKLPEKNETININVEGFHTAVNIAWNYFKQTGSGHIVGVTSIAAARGNKLAPAYHASKSFQSIYLESLRVRSKFEQNRIIITELIPGYLDTDMGIGNRLFWVTTVEKAAKQAISAIRKKKNKAFITKKWWIIFHFQRLLPSCLYDRIINGAWSLKRKS